MADNYRHLDYTYEELESLLKFLARIKDEEHRTLTKDEYFKVLDALDFLEKFDGNYENLTSKPQIPTHLSQLENDENFTSIDYNVIEDWVMIAASKIEKDFQDGYVTNSSMDNKYYDLFYRLQSGFTDIDTLLKTEYATKKFVKDSAYKLENHEHSPSDIGSTLEDGFTLEYDLETLLNKIDSLMMNQETHNDKFQSVREDVELLKSTFNTYKELYTSIERELQSKINEEVLNSHDHDSRYALKGNEHVHNNKAILDILDSASLTKWDAVTSFVGNTSNILLNSKDESFLPKWNMANSKITKCEVGGIPAGTNLNGMSISEILKMMLYPDTEPAQNTDSALQEALDKIAELESRIQELENK